MLTKIYVKNYILIDELELDLSKGLNIITGETGAGKSILINAIDIAFGAKAGKEVIKTGADKAIIEITINNKKQDIKSLFDEYGIDNCEDEIILSKEITQTGSRSRINGVLVTQDIVKILRELVVDIHSQHMTYTYIQPKYHINLLDSYGDCEHQLLLTNYKSLYSEYIEITNKLKRLESNTQASEQQIEFLKFQINEIELVKIEDYEEDIKLDEELNVLSNR